MTMTLQPQSNGNGGEIQQVAKVPGTLTLGEMLAKRRDMIAAVLPKHLAPERLIKLATMAVGRDPKLSRATALSIVNAVVKAAELGLDCSGTLGSAYLVAYDNNKKDERGNWYKQTEAQLIIGYRGLIDLARRSGQIASIEARVVWQNDQFEFEYGLEPKLRHIPALDKEPGELRLVYAIAKLRDGAMQVEVMTKAEIDKIKGRSKSGNNDKSPWSTDYPEMSRKTVVKRLCKYLPLSVEVQEVIAEDNVADPIDANDAREMVGNGERGIAALHKKITNKPVSENQQFEPTTEALEEAQRAEASEQRQADPLETLKAASPSTQQQAPELPAENQAVENGDEGAEGLDGSTVTIPKPATAEEVDTPEKFMDACTSAGMNDFDTPEEFQKWMNGRLMLVGKKGKLKDTSVDWRIRTLNELRAR